MPNDERKPLMAMAEPSRYNSTNQPNGKTAMQRKSNGEGTSSTNGYQGSVVSFHNLFYDVTVGTGFCKKQPKQILKCLSGLFKPGTMNAIMGPTGSGKSSLLNILAGRTDPKNVTGEVLIDGHAQPPNFRLMSGYVVQDDVVMSTLSIRENLRFSADLRLPKGFSSAEKKAKVEKIINELNLELCADTRCGDEYVRGVSGGERKRCSIGMELITSPLVLFLDEPTTGLDASTAYSVMCLLKRLAELGSTVIFSIHQPRYSIFKLCDSLYLLGNGQTIYHGPTTEAIDFFKLQGYNIEEHDNPADFFLDIILGNVESTIGDGIENTKPWKADNDITIVDVSTSTAERTQAISANLAKSFVNSEWGKKLEEDLVSYKEGVLGSDESEALIPDFSSLSYHTNPFTQFAVVSGRAFKDVMRNPRTSVLQIITLVFYGLMTGAAFFQSPKDCNSGIQNRSGAFFLIIMNLVFGNISAISLFISQRALFIHENVSGYYRISTFFLAKLCGDIVPNRLLPILLYSVIAYWMIGLVPKWQNFLFYFLTLILTSLAGASIAFVASASTRNIGIASIFCTLLFVFQMIFSGMLVDLTTLGEWLMWAKYVSIFNYAMKALQLNEFRDVDFKYMINGTNHSISCVKGNPSAYLEKNNIAYQTPWDLWQNIVALLGITVVIMMLAYIQLRRIKKFN